MGAFHVVGENLKLGLEVDGGRALHQQPFQRLLGVGLLRLPRNLDTRRNARRRLIRRHHPPRLAAHPFGACMAQHDIGVMTLLASCQQRSEEHTSELQSLMRISYAVFCLKKKNTKYTTK